jgi:hypothetical protein
LQNQINICDQNKIIAKKANVINCDCPICFSNLKKYHVNMISSTNVEWNFNSLYKQKKFNVEMMNITWKTRRYHVTTTKHVIWREHLQEACHNNKEINSMHVIWSSTWQLSSFKMQKWNIVQFTYLKVGACETTTRFNKNTWSQHTTTLQLIACTPKCTLHYATTTRLEKWRNIAKKKKKKFYL